MIPKSERFTSLAVVLIGVCEMIVACLPIPASAHGDLHEQIEALTRQIKADPQQAELYLKRGEIHRLHRDWKSAAADYDRALHLNPDLFAVELARGKMLLEMERFEPARDALDRFLARQSNHAEALLTRARVLAKLGQGKAAISAYTKVIEQSDSPEPDFYLERAAVIVALGEAHLGEALRGLDEGVQKLGPLVTLELAAIEIEIKRKNYDDALARVDQLSARSPRKETWLARRGDILEQAGRAEESRREYSAALKAIEALPPHTRKAETTARLEANLRAKLRQGAK